MISPLPICLAALLLGACSPGAAADIQVGDAWARASVPGQTATAAYLTIVNNGAGADRLLSVSSPTATLHASSTSEGVARMRPLADGIAVPAHSTLTLAPNGTHVMLTGLGTPLAPGDSLALTLRFERSGPVEVPVRIVEGTAAMPGMAH